MNIVPMKERVRREKAADPLFAKGQRLCLILSWVYLALRVADLLIPWLVFDLPLELSSSTLITVGVILCVFFSAIEGHRRFVGWLCILGALASVLMTWSLMRGYQTGTQVNLAEFFNVAGSAFYVAIFSIMAISIGFLFLENPAIRHYGLRRKEMSRELRADIQAQAAAANPESGAKQERKAKHRTRNFIIFLAVCTLIAGAAGFFMLSVNGPAEYGHLLAVEGELESVQEIEPAGNYELRLDGDPNTYLISSILDFPASQYQATLGDAVSLRCEDDSWHNIYELSVADQVWLDYDTSAAAYAGNNIWGLGLIGGLWLLVITVGLISYRRKKKKPASQQVKANLL